MGVLRPDLMMKCIVPVVMAGIIAVGRLACSFDTITKTVLLEIMHSADLSVAYM